VKEAFWPPERLIGAFYPEGGVRWTSEVPSASAAVPLAILAAVLETLRRSGFSREVQEAFKFRFFGKLTEAATPDEAGKVVKILSVSLGPEDLHIHWRVVG
jgi:hypothetical protein